MLISAVDHLLSAAFVVRPANGFAETEASAIMDGASSPSLPHPPTLFAEVYERFKNARSDGDEDGNSDLLEEVLDEENGLAASWADALNKV